MAITLKPVKPEARRCHGCYPENNEIPERLVVITINKRVTPLCGDCLNQLKAELSKLTGEI